MAATPLVAAHSARRAPAPQPARRPGSRAVALVIAAALAVNLLAACTPAGHGLLSLLPAVALPAAGPLAPPASLTLWDLAATGEPLSFALRLITGLAEWAPAVWASLMAALVLGALAKALLSKPAPAPQGLTHAEGAADRQSEPGPPGRGLDDRRRVGRAWLVLPALCAGELALAFGAVQGWPGLTALALLGWAVALALSWIRAGKALDIVLSAFVLGLACLANYWSILAAIAILLLVLISARANPGRAGALAVAYATPVAGIVLPWLLAVIWAPNLRIIGG